MLNVKQGSIKYRFLSLYYDSTCDWTLIYRVIGEHSNHKTNEPDKVNFPTLVDDVPNDPFFIADALGRALLDSLDCSNFTLDPYLLMFIIKQDCIKYHFLSVWYDSTLGWTPVSRTPGEHSTH